MSIRVIEEKCVGCGLCSRKCPQSAITVVNKKASIDESKCIVCKLCVNTCRFNAIEVVGQKQENSEKSSYKGIAVYAESIDGKFNPVAYELLSKANDLVVKTGENVFAFVLGSGFTDENLSTLCKYADFVYVVDNPFLEKYRDDVYSKVMAYILKQYKPSAILSGSTIRGRSFMPRVATELETGLTADCISIEMDENTGNLIQTRPAFGGDLMASILCENTRPQMSTVRQGVFPVNESINKNGKIVKVDVPEELLKSNMEILGFEPCSCSYVNIADYDIVVAGGRGLRNEKGFALLRQLADLLGGCVAGSRPACDCGFIPHSAQIGQTGVTIKPKLYLAIGISGAVQHISGVEEAELIIAVNTDPNAPIFDIADYGIIADAFEFLPALIEKIKDKKFAKK